jgi:hypothetical protein
MKYYQYDDNALYIGSGDALPGDVPGSWIYPHNITSVAPPTDELGKWKWGGDVWRAVTPEELAEQRKAEIQARLAEIDTASIRPLRAVADNTATDFDRQKLADLEAEAAALRAELAGN